MYSWLHFANCVLLKKIDDDDDDVRVCDKTDERVLINLCRYVG